MRTRTLMAGAVAGAVCLLAAMPVSAQTFTVKVKGGLDIARFVFDPSLASVYTGFGFDTVTQKTPPGLVVGGVVSTALTEMLSVQVEGLVTRAATALEAKGTSGQQNYTFTRKITLTSVEVPVLASFAVTADKKLEVQGGMFFSFKASQHEKVTEILDGVKTTDIDLTANEQSKIKKTNYGVAAGAHYAITDMIAIGGRANFGLVDVQDEAVPIYKTVKTRAFTVFAIVAIGGM